MPQLHRSAIRGQISQAFRVRCATQIAYDCLDCPFQVTLTQACKRL